MFSGTWLRDLEQIKDYLPDSLVLGPTLQAEFYTESGVSELCPLELHLCASHSIAEAHFIFFIHNSHRQSQHGDISVHQSPCLAGGRLRDIVWRMHVQNIYFPLFSFFFKECSQPSEEKHCNVMQFHQCEDFGSDRGAWYLFPSAVARQTCY